MRIDETTEMKEAANIIRDAGGQIVGRTRLQKIAYLLELVGLGDDFDFEYRHYGPYSDRLASAVSTAVLLRAIHEDERLTAWGGHYSVFTAEPISEREPTPERLAFIKESSKSDPVALELAATAAFLACEGEEDPWGATAKRKPEKADPNRLAQAKALYEQLSKINTPIKLPKLPS